jgi:hypothetical protein
MCHVAAEGFLNGPDITMQSSSLPWELTDAEVAVPEEKEAAERFQRSVVLVRSDLPVRKHSNAHASADRI